MEILVLFSPENRRFSPIFVTRFLAVWCPESGRGLPRGRGGVPRPPWVLGEARQGPGLGGLTGFSLDFDARLSPFRRFSPNLESKGKRGKEKGKGEGKEGGRPGGPQGGCRRKHSHGIGGAEARGVGEVGDSLSAAPFLPVTKTEVPDDN